MPDVKHIHQPTDIILDVDPENPTAMRSEVDSAFRDEQLADETLQTCWLLAKRGKGSLFVKNELLFRRDRILGQSFDQVVLPSCRRSHALKIAHETSGGHMGGTATRNRLRYSFWWPTLMKDAKEKVSKCAVCSRRARVTCFDRVPISPIPRSERSFNHWFCDVLGSMFPNQSVSHNYCFVCCDSFSR